MSCYVDRRVRLVLSSFLRISRPKSTLKDNRFIVCVFIPFLLYFIQLGARSFRLSLFMVWYFEIYLSEFLLNIYDLVIA
jgi:hypothetical protein